MITKKIYIVYQPGSHGSYIRWLIDYANDIGHRYKNIQTDLTASDGSAHYADKLNKHIGGFAILDTLNDNYDYEWGYIIYRVLPILHNDNNDTNFILEKLSNGITEHDKIIYIDIDTDYLKELTYINIELKTTYEDSFNESLIPFIKNWDSSITNFFTADRWIKRELLSLYFRGMINSLTKKPNRYSNVLYIGMQDILFGNNDTLTRKILDFCELPLREEAIKEIIHKHKKFLDSQKAITYHKNMSDALDNCLKNIDAPLGEMSLFAESILQEKLRSAGHEIKCYNLNQFPKTTLELINLFE